MHQLEVLEELYEGRIEPTDALAKIAPPVDFRALKKARFIKMRIIVHDEGLWVNLFLRLLFCLPFPIVLLKLGLKFVPKKHLTSLSQGFSDFEDMTVKDVYQLIRYAHGTTVKIDADNARIAIKIR